MAKKSALSTEEIHFLLLLWQTHSITQTARTLNQSVAKTSRVLTSLKEIFDDELFVRSGNAMMPTRRMDMLVPKLRKAKQMMEDLVTEDEFNPEKIDREFHISINDNAFITLLLPVLATLREKAPNLRLRLAAPDNRMLDNLRTGKIDFAFFYDPDGNALPSDINEQQLFVSEHVAVVRADHPLAKLAEPIDEKTLFAYPMASVGLPNPKGENSMEVMLRQGAPLTKGKFVETIYFATIPFVLMESDAFGFMTRELAQAYQRYMPLKILTLRKDAFPQLRQTWRPSVIWHARSNDDHALQWLRATVIEHFQAKRTARR